MDDDFAVRVACKAMPFAFQLRLQLLKVVDLAIEGQLYIAILVLHGLATVVTQVDDAEAAMAQRNAICRIDAILIGSTMRNSIIHF